MRVFAPHRGFSQLVTSFFASESLGIPHAPFNDLFLFFLSPLPLPFVCDDGGERRLLRFWSTTLTTLYLLKLTRCVLPLQARPGGARLVCV